MRLLNYIVKRLLLILPVILGVSIIVFSLSRMTGGDPAAAYINDKMTELQIAQVYAKYHFDEPVGISIGTGCKASPPAWGWSITAVPRHRGHQK